MTHLDLSHIAVVTIDNPPMNTMSQPGRARLFEDLKAAIADPACRAVVVRGEGAMFCAGAEVREFNTPLALAAPDINDITGLIESTDKPVVALIEGVALGGGLEVALGCHYRLMARTAKIGLPEVKLGILPGAGGTQRTPRLIGAAAAIDLMTKGEMLTAGQAFDLGIVDEVIAETSLEAARVFLAARIDAPPPCASRRAVSLPEGVVPDDFFATARVQADRASRGNPAPAVIVDCVRAAATRSFDEGLAFERESFNVLVQTPQSKALRHVFFAERTAKKVPGLPAGTPARFVEKVGIVGAGTMGTGIAMAFALAGYHVSLFDQSAEALVKSRARMNDNLASMARRARVTEEDAARASELTVHVMDLEDLSQCDLVVEAVVEDMAVKTEVFQRLDAILRPGAILASNTSFLDLDLLASATSRPGDVLGLHFFSPANIMRLVEVVRGGATAPDVLVTALATVRRLGKAGVVSGVTDGFIGNRMIDRYLMRAYELVAAGAEPRQVDRAMEKFGFAMGPFAMQDLSGNDIGAAVRLRKIAEYPGYRYPGYLDLLTEHGWYGQKTGRGWYVYEPGSRTPLDHPELAAELAAWRLSSSIVPVAFSDQEIVERCVFTLVDEGARLLSEKVALRASDIDTVYVCGFGFPAVKGGPMYHAEQVGLQKICEKLDALVAIEPDSGWEPSAHLRTAARNGTFSPVEYTVA